MAWGCASVHGDAFPWPDDMTDDRSADLKQQTVPADQLCHPNSFKSFIKHVITLKGPSSVFLFIYLFHCSGIRGFASECSAQISFNQQTRVCVLFGGDWQSAMF